MKIKTWNSALRCSGRSWLAATKEETARREYRLGVQGRQHSGKPALNRLLLRTGQLALRHTARQLLDLLLLRSARLGLLRLRCSFLARCPLQLLPFQLVFDLGGIRHVYPLSRQSLANSRNPGVCIRYVNRDWTSTAKPTVYMYSAQQKRRARCPASVPALCSGYRVLMSITKRYFTSCRNIRSKASLIWSMRITSTSETILCSPQ